MLPTVISVIVPVAALAGGVGIGLFVRDQIKERVIERLSGRLAEAADRIADLDTDTRHLRERIEEYQREEDERHRSHVGAGLKSWQTRRAKAEG